MTLENFSVNAFLYVLAGAFAGLMSGALGIGGGIVVVPALLALFHYNANIPTHLSLHLASGTSLAIMIFTAQSSVRAHLKEGEFSWPAFHHLWPGIIVGTVAGAAIAYYITEARLNNVLGVILLVMAAQMRFSATTESHEEMRFPSAWINFMASSIIGSMSGLLGLGGGLLMIPYLLHCGVEMRKIPAISALCTMIVSVIGTITVIITGMNWVGLPAYSTGFVYWPAVFWVAIPSMLIAPYGAKLTYIVPAGQLRRVFIIMLVVTGIKLIF